MESKISLKILHLTGYSIFEQLKLEEALLRVTEENWCILNHGSPPSIVMGISGKPHELIELEKIKIKPVPIIKRYSGGGTVIVDADTLFVSFIFQKEAHLFSCYPEPILRWSESFYKEALSIGAFNLRENDYVIGERKCGGNAQYIKKHRFVHHTTFIWDFSPEKMEYLLHPKKTPSYRLDRPHLEFLCRLRDYLPSEKDFFSRIKKTLKTRYKIKEVDLESLLPFLGIEHRRATVLIEPE